MRLYCHTNLETGHTIPLTDEAATHARVLRLKVGESITLFNGQKGEYEAEITSIGKTITATIRSFIDIERELPYTLTLIQSLAEGSKMDFIVEKAVECGIHTICPLSTEKSVTKLSTDRVQKRYNRWHKIVIAASEQCGRNQLTHIAALKTIEDLIFEQPALLCSPTASLSLVQWSKTHPPQSISLLIGTEAGFSEKEEQILLQKGAIPVSLGQRTLRTETAGIVATSMLNALWLR